MRLANREQEPEKDPEAPDDSGALKDSIEQMRAKFQNKDFADTLEEFHTLVSKEEEPEQEASMMDAFFSIFS